MDEIKESFLAQVLDASIIRLGTFTLKSGRISPYFFDLGSLHRADRLCEVSNAYAQTIIAYNKSNLDFAFDILFGPAYKGIPLAVSVVSQLAALDPEKYGKLSFSFNRKEKKDHGEGGSIVGGVLEGARILVIDDVISAGTAMRETVEIIKQQKGHLVGVIVAFDRQERMTLSSGTADLNGEMLSDLSAIEQMKADFNVPVMSIIGLQDLLQFVRTNASEEQVSSFQAYWDRYRAAR